VTHWIVIPIYNEVPSIAAVVRTARRHGPVQTRLLAYGSPELEGR